MTKAPSSKRSPKTSPELLQVAAKLRERAKLPVLDALGRLIRPTFVAPPGRVFVWADWSNIEGRIIAWLAPHPTGARTVTAFARGDDIYCIAAEAIHGVPAAKIAEGHKNKDPRFSGMRSDGKVVSLACGFGGGANAIIAMAEGAGISMTVERAEELKEAWRGANPWGRHLWQGVEAAAQRALRSGAKQKFHRLTFGVTPKVGRSLVCRLPSGRPLMYPKARVETHPDQFGKLRSYVVYSEPKGDNMVRHHTWGGTLAQNATQAIAADLLRQCLVRLDAREDLAAMDAHVVLHTHDEVLVEGPEEHREAMEKALLEEMLRLPPWARGLPLACADGAAWAYHYTKAEG